MALRAASVGTRTVAPALSPLVLHSAYCRGDRARSSQAVLVMAAPALSPQQYAVEIDGLQISTPEYITSGAVRSPGDITSGEDGHLSAKRSGPLMLPMPCSYVKENWLWEGNDQCPYIELSPGRQEVYFHTDPVLESCGTAGVRGDTGFLQGEHYWEIEFLEPPSGLSVMVGVGTSRAPLCAGSYQYLNLLGLDADSWGLSYKGKIWHRGSSKQYTEPFYAEGTLIGVHLNMEQGTLTFHKDRQSLGLAFTGLHKVQLPLFPMVSSTSPGTELALRLQYGTLPTLEERCLSTLARNITQKDSADLLPLPAIVRWKLKSWKNWDDTERRAVT